MTTNAWTVIYIYGYATLVAALAYCLYHLYQEYKEEQAYNDALEDENAYLRDLIKVLDTVSMN